MKPNAKTGGRTGFIDYPCCSFSVFLTKLFDVLYNNTLVLLESIFRYDFYTRFSNQNFFFLYLCFLFRLWRRYKRRSKRLFTAAAIFLLAAQIKFTRSICFQPRPQRVCSAKTHVNVRKKAAQRKIILRNSGNCLCAFYLRT